MDCCLRCARSHDRCAPILVFACSPGWTVRWMRSPPGRQATYAPSLGLKVGQAASRLQFAVPDGSEPVQLSRSVMVFTSEGCSWRESLVADLSIHPFDPGEGGRVVWDAKDPSPIPALPDWGDGWRDQRHRAQEPIPGPRNAVWRRGRRRCPSRRSRDPEQFRRHPPLGRSGRAARHSVSTSACRSGARTQQGAPVRQRYRPSGRSRR